MHPSDDEPTPADDRSPAPRGRGSLWMVIAILVLVAFNGWVYVPLMGRRGDAGPPPPPPGGERPPAAPRGQKPPPGSVASGQKPPPGPPPPGPGPGPQKPPRPTAPEPGPLDRLAASELTLALLVLEQQPKLRLDAGQVQRLLPPLRALEAPMREASAAADALKHLLTVEQRKYLLEHRGPLDLRDIRLERPGQNPVLTRALEITATRGQGASPAVARAGATLPVGEPALGQEEMLAAPIRLAEASSLQLTPAQAAAFHAVLERFEQLGRKEEEVRRTVSSVLRPDQVRYLVEARDALEVMRRMASLHMVLDELSPGGSR